MLVGGLGPFVIYSLVVAHMAKESNLGPFGGCASHKSKSTTKSLMLLSILQVLADKWHICLLRMRISDVFDVFYREMDF